MLRLQALRAFRSPLMSHTGRGGGRRTRRSASMCRQPQERGYSVNGYSGKPLGWSAKARYAKNGMPLTSDSVICCFG